MLEDIRYALRLLVKSPGFTAAAVLSLALGIGANTAIFSLIDTVMLKTLPVPAPEQLVILGPGDDRGVSVSTNPITNKFSYPRYRSLRDGNTTLASLAAIGSSDYNVYVKQDSGPRRTASVRMVSGNYFSTLQVSAAMGRALNPGDDQVEASGQRLARKGVGAAIGLGCLHVDLARNLLQGLGGPTH